MDIDNNNTIHLRFWILPWARAIRALNWFPVFHTFRPYMHLTMWLSSSSSSITSQWPSAKKNRKKGPANIRIQLTEMAYASSSSTNHTSGEHYFHFISWFYTLIILQFWPSNIFHATTWVIEPQYIIIILAQILYLKTYYKEGFSCSLVFKPIFLCIES